MGKRTIVVERDAVILVNARTVWSLVEDVKLLPMWLASVERVEELEAKGAAMRLRFHRRRRTLKHETDVEVTAFEPGRLFAWRIEEERMDGKPQPRYARETRFQIWVTPEDEGSTTVRLRSEQDPAGRLRGLAIRMFGRRDAEIRLAKSLERLQMVASSQA